MIQKSLEGVWHVEKYLKMLDFPKKRDKTSRLLRNTQQVSFHMYRSFGIIHLDYVFSATFMLLDFIHIYFHIYIYIYIYIYNDISNL